MLLKQDKINFNVKEYDLATELTSYSKCRICFSSLSNEENPLMSPCKCSGSISYIHFLCLKQYLDININKEEGNETMYYFWKNDFCELCLTKYPKVINLKNKNTTKQYELLHVSTNSSSYLKFQIFIFNDEKQKFLSKGYILTDLNKLRNIDSTYENLNNDGNRITRNELNKSLNLIDTNNCLNHIKITIGRNLDNNIILKESTVSRLHCTLNVNFNNQTIKVISDNPKFGTLKLFKTKNFIIDNDFLRNSALSNLSSISQYANNQSQGTLFINKNNKYNYPFLINSNLKFNYGKHLFSFDVYTGGFKLLKNYFKTKLTCCTLTERNRNKSSGYNENDLFSNKNSKNTEFNDCNIIENEICTSKHYEINLKENILVKSFEKYHSDDSLEDCEFQINTIIRNDCSYVLD